MPKMKVRLLPAIILVALMLICRPVLADVDGGYMKADTSGLLYVRFNENKGNLGGFIQVVGPDLNAANAISVQKYDIRGTVKGNKVAFSVGGFLGMGAKGMDGEVSGKRLTLHFDASDGRINTNVLIRVSNDEWNKTLGKFTARQ